MKLRPLALLALCAVVSLAVVPGPASAQGRRGERHCAYRLEPESRPRPHVISARLVRIGCYETLSKSIAAGTDGSVRVPPSTSPQDLTAALLTRSASRLAADTLIGTEWTNVNYGGDTRSFYADNACASVTWEVPYVGDRWNDNFESGKGFGGCDTNRKFGHVDFGGGVVTCTPNCGDYGTLRNEVSSLKWKP